MTNAEFKSILKFVHGIEVIHYEVINYYKEKQKSVTYRFDFPNGEAFIDNQWIDNNQTYEQIITELASDKSGRIADRIATKLKGE